LKIYIVQPDDTLMKIASEYGVDLDKLKRSNPGLDDSTPLVIGSKIRIPSQGVRVAKESAEQKENDMQAASMKIDPLPPMPKWWYEEEHSEDVERSLEPYSGQPQGAYEKPQVNVPYQPYPPSFNTQQYDGYNYFGYSPPVPVTFDYSYSSWSWPGYPYSIFHTNRFPIPPRIVNVNGVRRFKLPVPFFHMDDWAEEWDEELRQS